MKKVLLLLFASFGLAAGLRAEEIRFEKNKTWKQILALAKQKNKPIFFDAYASWCGPCQYMDESVYTNSEVAAYYNANFINVKVDMEEGEGPTLSDEFNIGSYPTFLFISPEGKILHRSVGAKKPKEFIQLGKDANDPSKQYYTLKEKARLMKLTDAEFAGWAAQASRLGDEDLAKITAMFLATKNDILANEHIANVVLKYADSLSGAQLSYLVKNEAKLASILKMDKRATAKAVYNKLFKLATKEYYRRYDKKDFSAFIRRFDPARVNLASKDLEFRIIMYLDENSSKAASALLGYLNATERLSLEQVTDILFDNISDFSSEDKQMMAGELLKYKLKPADAGQEAWLYLMQMACYYDTGDTDAAMEYGRKAYQKNVLPDEYIKLLEELFGFS